MAIGSETGTKNSIPAANDEIDWRSILEASPVPMALNDDDENIVYVNPALTRALGYRHVDIPTLKKWFHLAYPDPDYREWVVKEWARRLAFSRQSETPFETMVVRIRKSDGHFLEMQATAADIANESSGLHLVTLTDVTALKIQEREIDDQRRRLNDILRGTHVGTWEWDIETGATIFNERWAEIIGYTLKELEPLSIESWMKLAHPDDLKHSGELLEKHFSGEMPYYECEARMRHKNGHWVWVLDRGMVSAWSPGGKPRLMSGTHQDISGHKQAQAELQQQRDELDDLYNHAPCGYHSIDADGTILRINDTELAWLGYSREEIVGKRRITDFVTPKSVKSFREDYPIFKTAGQISAQEIELVGKNGEITPVLLSGTAIRDEQGNYVKSRSVLVDYRKIREQQETLRRTLTAAPLAVRIAHLADDRVVFVNKAYCELVKHTAEDAFALDISQFYCNQDFFQTIKQRLGHGETVLNELLELHIPDQPDEPHLWVLGSFMVIDYLGVPSTLGWLYDISDREQIRQRLEQHRNLLEEQVKERTLGLSIAKEAAEAADRLKSSILRNISHEFRTPMNGILGMLSVLELYLEDAKHKEYLSQAQASAENLLNTLTALTELADAESGCLTLDEHPFDVPALLLSVRTNFEDKAKAKGISLRVGYTISAEFSRLQFVGDASRIRQILFELVGNAIKFSDHGRIEILATIDLNLAGKATLTTLVTDEGLGIDEKDLAVIFEPFRQVDGSSTRLYGGNGIGLALCRRLSRQMGGDIDVTSAPGEGSAFTLYIPLSVLSEQSV